MFVLEVTAGPSQGQAIELRLGNVLSIGRDPDCNIGFDDPRISSWHAEVSWTEDGFAAHDLGSLNGTFVNGARIEGRVGLRLGDFIQVAQLILQLKQVAADTSARSAERAPEHALDKTDPVVLAESAQTAIVRRPSVSVPARALSRAASVRSLALGSSGQRTMMGAIPTSIVVDESSMDAAADLARIVAGPTARGAKVIVRAGDRLESHAALPLTIGREKNRDIILDGDTISLRHALIDQRDGHFEIRDDGSSNGTFVNGERAVQRRLRDGDVLHIGSYVLLVVAAGDVLGLEIGAPGVAGAVIVKDADNGAALGVIATPAADRKRRKKRKKASELVWFATSDLDRGVYRARSALIALFVGLAATGWLVVAGDSTMLAGGALMASHESEAFAAQAAELGQDRCTGCHIGGGQVSTLKCLDCHQHSRPRAAHADVNLACQACHIDHRGRDFSSAASAALSCTGCHPLPHGRLLRLRPELVTGFSPDAPADTDFHFLHHVVQRVGCPTCHGPDVTRTKRGVRGACGQCHAPDHVGAEDCRQCHPEHPDRTAPTDLSVVKASFPPRFRTGSIPWTLALIALPFVLAAFIPRKRRVVVDLDSPSEE